MRPLWLTLFVIFVMLMLMLMVVGCGGGGDKKLPSVVTGGCLSVGVFKKSQQLIVTWEPKSSSFKYILYLIPLSNEGISIIVDPATPPIILDRLKWGTYRVVVVENSPISLVPTCTVELIVKIP